MRSSEAGAAMISSQRRQSVTSLFQTGQNALREFCADAHKKGADFALTSKVTLRHYDMVRGYVHDERVLAQPMTPE
jgi:uncharacterized protein (UPF0264 family)